jgi:hypothetical protein
MECALTPLSERRMKNRKTTQKEKTPGVRESCSRPTLSEHGPNSFRPAFTNRLFEGWFYEKARTCKVATVAS